MIAAAQIAVFPSATHAPRASAIEILKLLADGLRRGQRGTLATIVSLTSSGARAVGTQMAVLDNGATAGSLSNGCVEAAIAAEALEVLRDGKTRVVRFGQGSPYIDIRLPCGGGIDILFQPVNTMDAVCEAIDLLTARQPVKLQLGWMAPRYARSDAWAEGERDFSVFHTPPLRIVVFGNGPETLAFIDLAQTFGAITEVHSPASDVVEASRLRGAAATRLLSVSSQVHLRGDPWTAFLFLFHDHDWEIELLTQVLSVEALWIGAMGSPRTHASRCEALVARGVSPETVSRIKGPVGLIRSTRDPSTLALSVLAEIVEAYGRTRSGAGDEVKGFQEATALSLIG